jgi:serine/threonine-protein kinase
MEGEKGVRHDAAAPARDGELQAGDEVLGRYRVVQELGRGGMGAVYWVRHTKTNRDLALKLLIPQMIERRPTLAQRFIAEAQAAAALNHRAIVEIVDMDTDRGRPFIVMEKLEGEELLARITRESPLPIPWVVNVGIDIADAMSTAHEHAPKIIHRDLKPQNIFLARSGRERDIVKILDFGIAKLIEENGVSQELTATTDVYGTPLYMSPEQLRSAKDVDERTDVYAIGVILYQALTGRTPFWADSFAELAIKVTTEVAPPLRELRTDVPPVLAAVIDKAMSRSRELRFASAAGLRDALIAMRDGRTTDALQAALPPLALAATLPGPSAQVPAAPPDRSGRRAIAGVMLAAVVLGGAVAAWRAFGTSAPATTVTSPAPAPALQNIPATPPQEKVAKIAKKEEPPPHPDDKGAHGPPGNATEGGSPRRQRQKQPPPLPAGLQ